jgi:shikimate kinase
MMLERLMILYQMSMLFDVRSPMPHLVGPAGSGKSSGVEELADLLGVDLHVMNVSRLSPLEVEGVQMPHGTGEEMILKMLPATFWTRLKEGDIILMDEFLRGFAEVYNALLDIFTSRKVGSFTLPKVFIIGASNSVVTYDAALEDRLIHIPVADPRRSKHERERLAELLVQHIGLMPAMKECQEMEDLLHNSVLPGFNVLDAFKKNGQKVVKDEEFVSIRNLIGQAQMRYVQTGGLKDLIHMNNIRAMQDNKPQYVVILDGASLPPGYETQAAKLVDNPRLTDIQAKNIQANMQLIELDRARREMDDE